MRFPAWILLILPASLLSARQPEGQVMMRSGRAIPAVAYEILSDQIKITQPDEFVLYLPIGQVDLEATASTLGAPGPPRKPGEMRTLWVKKTEGRELNALGVVESLQAWRQAHPKSSGGGLSVDTSKVAADTGGPAPPAAAEPVSESRIERGRGPEAAAGASSAAPMTDRRRELAQRLSEMRAEPGKFSQGEYTRLQEQIDAFDQELYERQQKAWEERSRN